MDKTLEKALPWLIAAGAAVTGGLLIRSAIKKAADRKNFKEALYDGNAESWANDFYIAFHGGTGWGTDEDLALETVAAIPTKRAWEDTIQAYYKLYRRNLSKDVTEELGDGFEDLKKFKEILKLKR